VETMAEITTGIIIFLLGFTCSSLITVHQVGTALKVVNGMINTLEKASKALDEVTK
jgi:hypothetical protein